MYLEREQKIKEIFFALLEHHSPDQFLAQACAGDADLYKDILLLWECHNNAKDFLEQPATDLAFRVIKEQDATLAQSKDLFLQQLVDKLLDGKYWIEKLLGKGGMGAVYQAIHIGTKRPVALKVIAPQFMMYREFIERFKREAEAAGRLIHPNVVNVTDFAIATVENTKVAYLVMEYLDGCTLGELMKKKGTLSLGLSIDILEQICLAVDAAHQQGIIHRDLKPDNIWLQPNGRNGFHVKVLDFGLAKLHTAISEPFSGVSDPAVLPPQFPHNLYTSDLANSSLLRKIGIDESGAMEKDTAGMLEPQTVPQWLTRVGMVLGTPLYMSPEQCQGKEIDPRSDIYSIGIIAYEMLRGETPFKGDFYQLTHKHSEMPPPSLHTQGRRIPTAIADLIMSALAKNPSQRPMSAKALATILRTNWECETPLLHRAFDFYRSNFSLCHTLSTLVNSGFVIFSYLLLFSLTRMQLDIAYADLLQVGGVLLSFLSLFLAGEFSTAAFTLMLEKAEAIKSPRLKITTILYILTRSLPAICSTAIRAYLATFSQIWKLFMPAFHAHVEYSLCGVIVVSETMKGNDAMKRSKDLLKHFYSLAFSLRLRALLIKTTTFLLLFLVLFLCNFIFNDAVGAEVMVFPHIIVGVGLALVIPGLFLTLTSPLVDMALAFLYFKAREAKGENLYQVKQSEEEIEIAQRFKFTRRRKVALACSLIVTLLFSGLSFFLIVPPATVVASLPRPQVQKIPDEQNAWQEYYLAIQELLDLQGDPQFYPQIAYRKTINEFIYSKTIQANNDSEGLSQSAYGQREFSPKQLAYLDSKAEVLEHLLAGVKRPYAQFYKELPTVQTPVPNLIEMRGICNIAIAQARRLYLTGKREEAAELIMAAYHLGTDIAEPNALLISDLIAIVCRRQASTALFTWLNAGGSDVATEIAIARQLAALDQRMVTPDQALRWEMQSGEISMEDLLRKGLPINADRNPELFPFRILQLFPGMHLRLHNSFILAQRNFYASRSGFLQNWDFNNLEKFEREQEKNSENSFYHSLSIGDRLIYLVQPNILSTMKSLYQDKINAVVLQAFIACSVYKKIHGTFPQTLAEAMTATGVEIPLDPTTAKPIGFRLENGQPLVWLAGFDGRDDGGNNAYDYQNFYQGMAGKDLVYRFGEMPVYFGMSK